LLVKRLGGGQNRVSAGAEGDRTILATVQEAKTLGLRFISRPCHSLATVLSCPGCKTYVKVKVKQFHYRLGQAGSRN
jgi:hypothetical protein